MIKDVRQGREAGRIQGLRLIPKHISVASTNRAESMKGTPWFQLKGGGFVIAATWQGLLDSCPRAFLIAEYAGSEHTRPPSRSRHEKTVKFWFLTKGEGWWSCPTI